MKVALVVGLLACAAGAARADGPAFEIEPYAFVPMQVSGDATVADPAGGGSGERTVPVDVSIGDILDKLQFAAMARFEAWWPGVWLGGAGVVVDSAYAQLGAEGPVAGIVDLTTRSWVTSVIGQARLVHRDGAFLDAGGGLNVTWLQGELDLGNRSASASTTLFNGVVQARGGIRLSDTWVVGGRTSVTFPDVFWTIGAGGEWERGSISVKLGYQIQVIRAGGEKVDLSVWDHGPYVGVCFHFGHGRIY